jgi:hypothetical protein
MHKLAKGGTYVGLELGELETAAVHFNDLLALLLLLGFVDVRAGDDVGRVGFLVVLAWLHGGHIKTTWRPGPVLNVFHGGETERVWNIE